MTRIGLIAALAVVSAASAYAQMQRVDPAVPSALPESRIEPSGQLTETAPPQLVQNVRRHSMDSDARHCLDMPSNRQVHRCAERYRSRAARAAAAAKAPNPAATAKVSEMVKPPVDAPVPTGAPRPGDAAKAADIVRPMDPSKTGGTSKPVESAPKAVPPTKAAEKAPK